jgi:Na+/H+-dicarboxylate symporter
MPRRTKILPGLLPDVVAAGASKLTDPSSRLGTVGAPLAGIAIVPRVDRILDMGGNVFHVIGDRITATIVSRFAHVRPAEVATAE